MNWATGYGFTPKEIFIRFKNKYITTHHTLLDDFNKKKVAAKVFLYSAWLIINDIIDNNVTFQLPTQKPSYLEMGVVSGDEFVRARQAGAFEEIDFLASNFRGYKMQFRRESKNGTFIKPIYVNKKVKDRIIEHTNNGKLYG
jgi:hypothetical protein